MTENIDIANVAVNNSEKEVSSDNGLSEELIELKKEIMLMENNEKPETEAKKEEKVGESNNDTGSLLKQLDDELDELDNSNDDPIQSLLEEAQLLEENPSEPEKDSSNSQEKTAEEGIENDAPIEEEKENDAPIEVEKENDAPIEEENDSPIEEEKENDAPIEKENDAPIEQEKENDAPIEQEKESDAPIEERKTDDDDEEQKENDFSIEDIDDGDLKIIDEIEDENVSLQEEQNDEKDENDTNIPEVSDTQTPIVAEDAKDQDTLCKEATVTKVDEQPNDETIVLESDEEEGMQQETDTTVINKALHVSKRPSVDDNLINVEEPPSKRARSTPTDDISSNMLIEDAEEQNDKTVPVDENLLVVAGGNRRRSETDIEVKQVEKRAGSPIDEDGDSVRQIKVARAESVDSTSEDTKMATSNTEEDQSMTESLDQENGDISKDTIIMEEDKAETKTEPLLVERLELEPKPEEPNETEEKHSPLSIEFLKTFKKSFHLMSRSDLEDFVLQKVVEAIINKSEVSDLRQKNETQEKTIANQRQRINDLAKQFRDLEMVHNRVTKDLETKSTGLVTPVKITRAVGLQVSQPRPKTDFRPMYAQPNQRVPPFPSRSPQRPNSQMGNMNVMQPGQRMNMSLRPQNSQMQFTQSKTSPIRPIGQVGNNAQAKMIAIQKQQAMQRQQSMIQQQRNQPPVLQRSNSGALVNRSPVSLGTPGPQQRSPTVLNSLLSNQQSRGSPVVLRKIIRPGPASVQQAQLQALSQQQKSGQNKFIDLTDEEEAARSPNNVTATKIHVKSPATLNSSVTAPNLGNGLNRSSNQLNSSISNKLPVQRMPGNQFIQVAPKVGQNASPAQLIRRQVVSTVNQKRTHPAPLPIFVNKTHNPAWKRSPPRPQIRINNIDAGIVISWTIHEPRLAEDFDPIVKYQIYAYQETNQVPATESWRHVGDVKAMALPMAVTLTQFQEGQRYHFAVRAVDEHERAGTFSVPRTWDEKT